MSYKFSPLQRAWLDALKSGKYRQGKRVLARRLPNKKVEYCCLGVACVVGNENGVKSKKTCCSTEKVIAFDNMTGCLPPNIQKALKMRDHIGVVSETQSLAYMNDSGKTHKEIAEYIEANPDKIFFPNFE